MPTKARSAAPSHPAPTFEDRRGSACERGYGRRWEKLRQLILHRDPLCMMRKNLSARLTLGADVLSKLCAGDSPSVHADHIIPKPLGDDTEANLQGCCAPCHSVKTRLIDPILRKGDRGLKS
jgi:5-methylcytosine-specific restriction endonuclease McrA